jgi:type IV secretion system protein VirB2
LARVARKSSIPEDTNRGEATKDKAVAGKDLIKMMAGGLAAAFWSGAAAAQDAYADPAGSSVIVSAVRWLEGTLLGTIATVVAVIAVASVGLLMLTGRINWRYGATVILGCFILFGAASIVAGIQSTASLGR